MQGERGGYPGNGRGLRLPRACASRPTSAIPFAGDGEAPAAGRKLGADAAMQSYDWFIWGQPRIETAANAELYDLAQDRQYYIRTSLDDRDAPALFGLAYGSVVSARVRVQRRREGGGV